MLGKGGASGVVVTTSETARGEGLSGVVVVRAELEVPAVSCTIDWLGHMVWTGHSFTGGRDRGWSSQVELCPCQNAQVERACIFAASLAIVVLCFEFTAWSMCLSIFVFGRRVYLILCAKIITKGLLRSKKFFRFSHYSTFVFI